MVQETRLDLKLLTALSLGMALLAGPALAQSDPPLTTLLRPPQLTAPAPLSRADPLTSTDRLFGDRPLADVDALTGAGSLSNPQRATTSTSADPAKPGSNPAACDRRADAARNRGAPGLAGGGSGPGEYARYLQSGHDADAKPPAAPSSSDASPSYSAPAYAAPAYSAPAYGPQTYASSTPGAPRSAAGTPANRPLYGGVDRPLWNDAPAGPAPTDGQSNGGATAPASGVDRPLWSSGTTPHPASDPCDGEAATRRTVATPPTATLFFGTGPAR